MLPNRIQPDLFNTSIHYLFIIYLNDNILSLLRNRECDQCLCGVRHPGPGLHQQHGSNWSQHPRRPLYQVKHKKCKSVFPLFCCVFLTELYTPILRNVFALSFTLLLSLSVPFSSKFTILGRTMPVQKRYDWVET